MYSSIVRFVEEDLREIEKTVTNLLNGIGDGADLSREVHERVLKMGCRLVSEIYERIDEEIFKSSHRKEKYYVEKKNMPRTIIDSMGTLTFKRRGYVSRDTGEYTYLLDIVVGIDNCQKVSLAAVANALEEAVESSYAKGGEKVNPLDNVSKESVKEWIHGMEIKLKADGSSECIDENAGKKENNSSFLKKIKNLYIVTDEDHVAAQFMEYKGDIRRNGVKRRNTIIDKLVVLYEQVIDEAPEGAEEHRYRLKGKHTFCGVYDGEEGNRRLWEEVQNYIDEKYDEETLEAVYVAGDGADWMREGAGMIRKGRFILDKFHMMKNIRTLVSHLDNASEMKQILWELIDEGDRSGMEKTLKEIVEATHKGSVKYKDVKKVRKWFMDNFDGIEARTSESDRNWECCAEAQVSHVLSDRLSSRPMGWSRQGCDRISKLRAYTRNEGKILDLLRSQEKRKLLEEKRMELSDLMNDVKIRQIEWKTWERPA